MKGAYEVEQGEEAPFTKEFKDLVDAGDKELANRPVGVELFVFHRYPGVIILPGDGERGAGVRRGRALNETCGQVLIAYSTVLLGEDGVHEAGAREHWGAVRVDGYLERYKSARAKTSLGRGEDIGTLAEDVAKVVDDRWRPARTMKVKRNVA